MKRRFGTAPSNGRDETARLAWWIAVVAALIALAYTSGKPPADVLYKWSTVAGALIQEAITLPIVLAIAGWSLRLLGLRLPERLGRSLRLIAGAFLAIVVFEIVYDAIVHPGNEQGLTPAHWEPHHAAAYIANGILICTLVPFVEELMFRGLGFALLEPYGTGVAIVVTGVLFGLSHGLVLELPIIAAFGCVLGWVRARTGSVFPGMVLHAVFNLIALIAAVTL